MALDGAVHANPYALPLERAAGIVHRWLADLPDRSVAPTASADDVARSALEALHAAPASPADVVDELATLVEPGLLAINSGRFFGWVMGGVLPAALAADWLVSGWDQNSGMRTATPGVTGVEEAAGQFLLELFGLPGDAAVGFSTGATTANTAGLAAARHAVLQRRGWNVETQGLSGAPPVTVLVGEEAHVSVDLALRYLGLGAPTRVPADSQGRIRIDALDSALLGIEPGGATIVCLQAGNLHSGAFDDLRAASAAAHRHDAWVHVDGAFGLWAAASTRGRALADGLADADSWATDAHKTLNVPYDCGVTVVRSPAMLTAALGTHASYLFDSDVADPLDVTLEMSRRARGVPVWAALRCLGSAGVAALVDRLMATAEELARRLSAFDEVTVLNDVVYTQVCAHVGSDERTEAVAAALIADGTTWISGSRWQGRSVLRISVSNWQTSAQDIDSSVAAVRRALDATRPG